MPRLALMERVRFDVTGPFATKWFQAPEKRLKRGARITAVIYRVEWEKDNWSGSIKLKLSTYDASGQRGSREWTVFERGFEWGRSSGTEEKSFTVDVVLNGPGDPTQPAVVLDTDTGFTVTSTTGWIGGYLSLYVEYEEPSQPTLTLSVPEWMKPSREYTVKVSYTDPVPFCGSECDGVYINANLNPLQETWIDFCAKPSGSAEWKVHHEGAYFGKIFSEEHGKPLKFTADLLRQPIPRAKGGYPLAYVEAFSKLDARPDKMEVNFRLQTYPTPSTCPPGFPWRPFVAREWELWAYADAYLYPDVYAGARWRVTVAGQSETLSLSALPEGAPRKKPGSSTFAVLSRKVVEGHTTQPIRFDVKLELLGDTEVLASWSQTVSLPASGVKIRVKLLQAGQPVAGGHVELRATDGTPIDAKYTDSQGVAEFLVTRYVIWDGQMQYQSYRVQSGEVYKDVTAPESGDVEVTLELAAPPPPPPPPPKRTVVVASHPVGVATTDPKPGTYQVDHGSTFTVKLVSVASGYSFKHWTVDGQVRTGTSVTVTVDRDYTIVAVCEPYAPPKSKVTVTAQPPLTTVPAPGTYEVDTGSWFKVEAKPADQFSHWLIDSTRYTANPIEVKIERDTTITAVPKPPVKCRVTVVAGEGGTTSPAPGTYEVEKGSSFTVTAVPQAGYRFSKWVVDGTEYAAESITIRVERDVTVTAFFEKVAPPPAPPAKYKVVVSSVPTGAATTDPPAGTYEVERGRSFTVRLKAVAPGYAFKHWVVNGEVRTGDSVTVTVDTDYTITAVCEALPPKCRVTVAAMEGGTTEPKPGTYEVDMGSLFTVRAIPSTGYRFVKWVVNGTEYGTESITFKVERDLTATAYFEKVAPPPPPPPPPPTPVVYKLTVQVVDRVRRTPLAGVLVRVDGYGSYTGSDGRVVFELAAGTYTVSAEARGYLSASQTVELKADASIVLELEPRSNRVTVYVYDADTKQPLEGATVVFDGSSAVTGGDGKAVFTLYTGSYTLSVSRDGYEGVTRGVEVYEDVQFDVLLRALAYTLTVQVVDAENGAPIPGATVTVDGRTGVTDAAGRVSFKLPSGRYVVSA
ncbi:MAG: hypothetical protein QXP81_10330, partial [Nitrososphaerota archaeon]